MRMSKKITLLLTVSVMLFTFVLSGCLKGSEADKVDTFKYKQIGALSVQPDFSYRTSELVRVVHSFEPSFAGVTVTVSASNVGNDIDGQAPDDLFDVGVGILNPKGELDVQLSIPIQYSHVVLQPNFMGLPRRLYHKISDLQTPKVASRTLVSDSPTVSPFSFPPTRAITPYQQTANDFWYISEIQAVGRPKDINRINLSKELLDDINTSLPEYKPVPVHNPQYLEKGKSSTLKIEKPANVWVTFVHEGAGYLNSLGYYTYPTKDGPPQSIEEIGKKYIVFPNASLPGDGGALHPGDSIYIGQFEPGTSIGWFLVADGWNDRARIVREHRGIYFSDSLLNPEKAEDKRVHTVLLYDDRYDIFIVGFEDLNREGRTDDDFNDLVFFALVDPVEAVGNVAEFTPIQRAKDSDGDGVIDIEDAFPDDPRYATFEQHRGTLAYEDMWPKLGDYDFNDVVVRYEYGLYGNAQGKIVRIDATFTVVASGAGYQNGLAMFLPVAEADLELEFDTEPLGGGLELFGHEKGTNIIIFNNIRRAIGATTLFNTDLENPHIQPVDLTFSLHFDEAPLSRTELGPLPFDVFVLADNTSRENHEIHLPDVPPTPLLTQGLLGTADDGSDVAAKRYYKTKRNNLPWALHIPGDWKYPLERVSIVDAYSRFGAWAESGGREYRDWYVNEEYRNNELLYTR